MFPNIGKLSCLRTLTLFIVSSEKGHSLAELCDLKLGGKLEIIGLENVGSLLEAKRVNLKDKKELRELRLTWNGSGETKADAEQVLDALQPHSGLKNLEILWYKGLRLPTWIGNLSSSLVYLKLVGCKNCVQLPSLGKFPSLRELEISDMDGVQYLDDDVCYDGVEVRAFPSLKYLILQKLPNLEQLLKVERGEMFPCLSDFTIHGCPKLGLPCLPSVKQLHLGDCSENVLLRLISSFQGLNLTFLDLWGSEDLTSFAEGTMRNLTCLKILRINNFPKLKELPYDLFYLHALERLVISRCRELESLPEQGWEGLHSLQNLEISNCKGLRSLPEGIQHLSSLKVMNIWSCSALRCLPEGVRHLASLQHLKIIRCPILE